MFHVLPKLTLVLDCILSEAKLESGKIRVNAQKVTVSLDKSKPNVMLFTIDKGKDGKISQSVDLTKTETLKTKDDILEACIIFTLNKLLSSQAGVGGVTLASLKASGFLSKDFSLHSVVLSEVYLRLLSEGLTEEGIAPYLQAVLDLPETQINQALYKSLACRSLGMGLDKIALPRIASSSVGYVAPQTQGKPKNDLEDANITGKETTEPEQKNNRLTRNRKEEKSLEKQLERLATV